MQWTQPDTITPGGPQGLNRYTYVLNDPLLFTDPNGLRPCRDDEIYDSRTGRCLDYDPDVLPTQSQNNVEEGYVGPLSKNIKDKLVAQGADPNLVNSVILNTDTSDIHWKLGYSSGKSVAVTWFNTIYWCMLDYYDQEQPNGYLLHELIHVRQFKLYPKEVLEELTWEDILKTRDKFYSEVRDIWNRTGGKILGKSNWYPTYDVYNDSWVEVQGKMCQVAFTLNINIPLDRPPCLLGGD